MAHHSSAKHYLWLLLIFKLISGFRKILLVLHVSSNFVTANDGLNFLIGKTAFFYSARCSANFALVCVFLKRDEISFIRRGNIKFLPIDGIW